ncbi:MAG: hypothetical protein RR959_09095 [Erysipelotrichaceae bacterium]
MKYFKLNKEVYAFELDGSQDDYIQDGMIQMSSEEVDRHINPDNYLTEQQKQEKLTKSLRLLSRKQFKLALLDKELLDELENSISNINDTTAKRRIQIEYTESTEFVRTSEVVKTMFTLLNKTEEEINSFWQYALTL